MHTVPTVQVALIMRIIETLYAMYCVLNQITSVETLDSMRRPKSWSTWQDDEFEGTANDVHHHKTSGYINKCCLVLKYCAWSPGTIKILWNASRKTMQHSLNNTNNRHFTVLKKTRYQPGNEISLAKCVPQMFVIKSDRYESCLVNP